VVSASVVALVLAVAAAALSLAGSPDDGAHGQRVSVVLPRTATTTAPTPSVESAVVREQALDELLEARSAAVRHGDAAAWKATVDPLSGEFARQQAAVFANLEAVPFADWRYEYAGDGAELPVERAAELGPDAWVARTVLVYRLAGAGTGDVRREQDLTLVRRGERWLVASATDRGSAPELWDLGPVHVVRGERSLVLGTADRGALKRFAAEADEAAAHVEKLWPRRWRPRVVVLVPRSQAEMARVLRREDEAGLDQIAAVTTGDVDQDHRPTAADRVVVNPAGFDRLGELGRQVVLRHEITHVATRATTTRDVPIWLSEGFADYVAYRDSGVSRAVVAQDVLERVRAGHPPAELPVQADFDPARGDIAPAYAASWVATDLVERRWGEPALMALFTAVADGSTTQEAFPRVLGVDQAAFTQQWRDYLVELAS
jgi:hypothetical protein